MAYKEQLKFNVSLYFEKEAFYSHVGFKLIYGNYVSIIFPSIPFND